MSRRLYKISKQMYIFNLLLIIWLKKRPRSWVISRVFHFPHHNFIVIVRRRARHFGYNITKSTLNIHYLYLKFVINFSENASFNTLVDVGQAILCQHDLCVRKRRENPELYFLILFLSKSFRL